MIKEKDILLTTKDNKFNPFTNYENWEHFDKEDRQYCTEAYVSWVVGLLDFDLSEEELAHERFKAFEEIIRLNDEMGIDIYVMITRDGKRLDNTPSAYLGQETLPIIE